jgi:hypothetical protein
MVKTGNKSLLIFPIELPLNVPNVGDDSNQIKSGNNEQNGRISI